MDKNKNIKKAREELETVSGDYEIRRIAELKEKAIRDEISIKEHAMKQGREQGIQQGIQQGIERGIERGIEQGIEQGIELGQNQEKIKIAKNMLLLKVELEVIEKATGLSRKEILKLK